jgi:hypothetical protein
MALACGKTGQGWARLGFSLIFSLVLLGGTCGIGCGSVLDDLKATLGESFGLVLVGYSFALAFALIGLIFQYFKMFADRGTPSRRLMSRGLAMLPLYGVAIFILIAHLSASYFCR